MAQQSDALAKVYAKSLYELAQEAGGEGKINEIAGELDDIGELIRSNRAFREFVSSPIIDSEARSESLKRIFGNRVTDLTLRFLLVLNGNNRLGRLESVANAYDHIVQEAFGMVEVDLFTAAPLGADQVQAIKGRIQQALGRDPVLHPYTEPAMLGGLKLRIGDQLIDGSVATQLRRMKQELLNEGANKLRDRISRFIEDKN